MVSKLINRRSFFKGIALGAVLLALGYIYLKKQKIKMEEDNPWISSKFGKEDIKKHLLDADILLTDLDDTLAPSPAFSFVKKDIWKNWKNPRAYLWIAGALVDYTLKGKNAQSELWFKYCDEFLDREKLSKIKLTDEEARISLYPNVESFFKKLPKETKKIIVSRDIEEIGSVYGRILGIEEGYYRIRDKGKKTGEILEKYPEAQSFLLFSDSVEDEPILDILEKNKKDCFSVYIADSPEETNERFSLNMGSNYKLLEEIISR